MLYFLSSKNTLWAGPPEVSEAIQSVLNGGPNRLKIDLKRNPKKATINLLGKDGVIVPVEVTEYKYRGKFPTNTGGNSAGLEGERSGYCYEYIEAEAQDEKSKDWEVVGSAGMVTKIEEPAKTAIAETVDEETKAAIALLKAKGLI